MFTLEDFGRAGAGVFFGWGGPQPHIEPKPNRQKMPRHDTADLGVNQLVWLRKHIPSFDRAWKNVQASDKYAAKVRAELGVPAADVTMMEKQP